jgi:predicted phosphodiesterase
MLKIKVVSDTHTSMAAYSFTNYSFMDVEGDMSDVTLILPGDIDLSESLAKYLSDSYQNVIMVLGNHDHYSTINAVELHKDMVKDLNNFHVLENEMVEIEGQRFLGCTLWFPETPKTTDILLQSYISDFRYVPKTYDMFEAHERSRRFLLDTVRQDDIVITHHVPTPRGNANKYKDSILNPFFVTDMYEQLPIKPKMWFYGHTHDFHNFTIDNTLFLCNPVGYHDEYTRYNDDLIIHIGDI